MLGVVALDERLGTLREGHNVAVARNADGGHGLYVVEKDEDGTKWRLWRDPPNFFGTWVADANLGNVRAIPHVNTIVSSISSRSNPELQSCASTDGGDGIHLSTTTSTFPAASISSTLTTTPRVSLDTTRLSARRLWARPNTLRVHARATHKLLLGTSAFTRHFRPGRLTAWRVCMDI